MTTGLNLLDYHKSNMIFCGYVGFWYWYPPAHGQVKLSISHHSLNANHDEVTSEKQLVFVVEPPKDDDQEGAGAKRKKKKNKDKSSVTMNSFGNGLCINKFKGNENFVIGFRCRWASSETLGSIFCVS